MTPKGWLDVHGHFFLPISDAEFETFLEDMRIKSLFLVPKGYKWSLDDTLCYMDSAGIQMQMLSYIPNNISKLRAANEYCAGIVKKTPTRFGQLCALPTDDPAACLKEIDKAVNVYHADGFAVCSTLNGVYFSDPSLLPVWQKLDDLGAVVHMHPNAYAGPTDGRPSPVIEVAFDTTRVATDMLYRRLLLRFPNIKIILAHCGGALPALSGRLALLGTEAWVPNPENVNRTEMEEQLKRFYVDTAATAATGLQPAVKMVGSERIIYGADCGVPCSTVHTMEENRASVRNVSKEMGLDAEFVGRNAWDLFPAAARRVEKQTNGF
ncbi:hypothetical protein NA57DRAFT_80182 [Rhizodiscina lignyota]|uniref:6-methylsalicylate decarboxylase n=1 Tax=Rhizodiscina lignyota TaxID=1504668 RepID=A0A9P4I6I1_9PEZI|nr:hypothetical protein NA57DRAFT_80182 [Rhizodiscina lignyota]